MLEEDGIIRNPVLKKIRIVRSVLENPYFLSLKGNYIVSDYYEICLISVDSMDQ